MQALSSGLKALKALGGVTGIAVDVHWGLVEGKEGGFNWAGYRTLLRMIADLGFKIKVWHLCHRGPLRFTGLLRCSRLHFLHDTCDVMAMQEATHDCAAPVAEEDNSLPCLTPRWQVSLCFHSTDCIPLPEWVVEEGRVNPDIYYTDKAGGRNTECLSLGVDDGEKEERVNSCGTL